MLRGTHARIVERALRWGHRGDSVPIVLPPPGYLDASAGQPLHAKAEEILHAAHEQAWADPDGRTPPSRQARALLDAACEQIASLLGTERDRISLVGDAPTAALGRLSGRLVHSAIERAEVMTVAMSHPSRAISVDSYGRIDLNEMKAALSPGDEVVLQAANGEVGTIQPLTEVMELAKGAGARVYSDFTHAIGVLPITAGINAYANASCWGGPRGVGIVVGDRQQHSPNLSVPMALAAAAALEGWMHDSQENDRLFSLISDLRAALAAIPDVDLVGDPVARLPHILTASFLYVDGQRLMDELARHGVYVGSGSACTASRLEPSHVLAAMGALTHGNVRVVLPRYVASSDVTKLAELLPEIVRRVRDDLR